jgi:hypothetical protein
LLVTAKVGTILVRVGIAIGMAGIGIALAGIAIKGGIPPEGLADVAPANMASVTGAILLLLVIAMASLALAYDFVTRLAQIIDTVGEGDPFTFGNAGRLRRMAWLAIVIQALGLLAMLPSGWLKAQLAGGMFHLGSDFSLMGVGLAIVLFVLARVFRQGAAMRADLEGTV